MAKVTGPLFSEEARGRLGTSLSYRKGKVWNQATGQFHRGPAHSDSLTAHRALYSAGCLAWGGLTPGVKEIYADPPRAELSSFNYFMQLYLLGRTFHVSDFIHDDGSGSNNVVSTMAYVPVFPTGGWPQAAHNGLTVGGFWFDVFKNSHPGATASSRGTSAPDVPGTMAATSQKGVSLWDDISWENARIAASNRVIDGRACHLVTPLEKFAVMSWIMKSGNWGNVRGNNNYGKDIRDPDEAAYYGTSDPLQAGRTLVGSGPASWWSGGVIGQGIHGLVGNVYEWEDCRIESGIIQPLAYLAGAATAADTYIDYDDNGGGDGVNIFHLTPGVYTITDAVNGDEDVTVINVLPTGRFTGRAILSTGLTSNHGDNCAIQLKTAITLVNGAQGGGWVTMGKLLEDATGKYMALPDESDTTTHAAALLDSWYRYNASDSRALIRAGRWDYTTLARTGLLVSPYYTPVTVSYSVGFRGALSAGNQ